MAVALLSTPTPPFQCRLKMDECSSCMYHMYHIQISFYHSADGVSKNTTALLHFFPTSPQKWELKLCMDIVCKQ